MEFINVILSYINAHPLLEAVIRLSASLLCGFIIGLERTKRSKEAGIRTHCIIASASALIMLVSKYGFADMVDAAGNALAGTRGVDPSRIAAQVVSGISFLGAGVIFKNGNTVKGLTTAAGVWATAAIGLAIGAGLYALGIGAALLVLLINICLHKWLVRLESMATSAISVTMNDTPGVLDGLRVQLSDRKMAVQRMEIKKKGDGLLRAVIVVRIPKSSALNDLLLFFGENPDIKEFSVEV